MKNSFVSAGLATALLTAGIASAVGWRQEWRMETGSSSDTVRFTVKRSSWDRNWTTTADAPLSSFRGFSRDMLSRGGKAQFEYVKDAGRLNCEGNFSWGHGSGEFTFSPNAGYLAELKRLGYDEPEGDDLFALMMADVSLDFARGVREAVADATTGQLIELRTYGVTLDYIREARQAGYRDFTAKDYVNMRVYGVSSSFLRDLQAAGYNLPARDIVELRTYGVTAEFMADLKHAGYTLTAKQISDLRIRGVSSKYLRDLKDDGLRPDASDLAQFVAYGVGPDYLKGLKNAGYGALTAKEIIELRTYGIDTRFVQDVKDLGYHFTPKELVSLRTQGVDGAYLRKIRDSGMKNLTAAQIAKLRIYGVE